MCTEMWLSTTTHTTLGERHAFALFFQIPFNYLYISRYKHSLVSENKTILGHLIYRELYFQFIFLSTVEHVPHILWEPLGRYWVNEWCWGEGTVLVHVSHVYIYNIYILM